MWVIQTQTYPGDSSIGAQPRTVLSAFSAIQPGIGASYLDRTDLQRFGERRFCDLYGASLLTARDIELSHSIAQLDKRHVAIVPEVHGVRLDRPVIQLLAMNGIRRRELLTFDDSLLKGTR